MCGVVIINIERMNHITASLSTMTKPTDRNDAFVREDPHRSIDRRRQQQLIDRVKQIDCGDHLRPPIVRMRAKLAAKSNHMQNKVLTCVRCERVLFSIFQFAHSMKNC